LRALPGRRRFGGEIFSAGRLMKILRRGRCAQILSAFVALVAAGPACADEVPYLMYIRGSEGPPATPFRVLWDQHDDANARITIDLGEKYEPALTKLALPRVLKYDAKLDKAQFVVRDPELTRFVKVVATSIVQGLLQASQLPGAWAQKPDADVQNAALHITPPRAGRLEVATWLHVTYLAPQKSGRPKLQDLIKGDIVFVGGPEPKGSDKGSDKGPDAATPPSKP
jgi:hypothetical protein